MPDILHDFPIQAEVARVFRGVSAPDQLDEWWTVRSAGAPDLGAEYQLFFGPEYDWRARVTRSEPGSAFELTLTRADPDWLGTRVGFELSAQGRGTQLRFQHLGWPVANQHYRTSCYCWAMYLRILRRFLEHGERVPYAERLDV
ncbi:MAG TPA: SRPBCC domain-containing protein [Gemmatimonadales bacterium]|jgi:uncharacterized protein YndB with AHSA1/START domain|nr:SRPBCC domain-containing protein [Gemmatimonadales bacterium]